MPGWFAESRALSCPWRAFEPYVCVSGELMFVVCVCVGVMGSLFAASGSGIAPPPSRPPPRVSCACVAPCPCCCWSLAPGPGMSLSLGLGIPGSLIELPVLVLSDRAGAEGVREGAGGGARKNADRPDWSTEIRSRSFFIFEIYVYIYGILVSRSRAPKLPKQLSLIIIISFV